MIYFPYHEMHIQNKSDSFVVIIIASKVKLI